MKDAIELVKLSSFVILGLLMVNHVFFRNSKNKLKTRIGTGKSGEDLAVRYLEKQGYTIIKRNYRQRIGEIDIIARDGKCLVFIEVKTRRTGRYGSPFEAVDSRKQAQISRVALEYITRYHYDDLEARFDVVAVQLDGQAPRIELIKNAFEYIG